MSRASAGSATLRLATAATTIISATHMTRRTAERCWGSRLYALIAINARFHAEPGGGATGGAGAQGASGGSRRLLDRGRSRSRCMRMSWWGWSWDLHLSDLCERGPLGHEAGQQRECRCPVPGGDAPPQAMSAREAARRRAAVPQRAVEAVP